MTSLNAQPTDAAPSVALRIVALLNLIVGILSIVGALSISLPAADSALRSWTPLVVNLAAALLMCAAAALTWKRLKLAWAAIVLAWALPSTANLLFGHGIRAPSLVMILAFLGLVTNWRDLR